MDTISIEHLDALLDFQHNATLLEFRKVFGHLGDHLWNKFEATDSNLLKFYSKLDDHNAGLLIAHLNQRSRAASLPWEHSAIVGLAERHDIEEHGI